MTFPVCLNKYQICTVANCGADAVSQVVIPSEGVTYYCGVCANEDHKRVIQTVELFLRQGDTLEGIVALEKDHVFIRPLGHPTKYKYRSAVTVSSDWFWEYRPHKWRDVHGRMKDLTAMSHTELTNAIWAIVGANYKRISQNVAWVYGLKAPNTYYVYDVDSLKVGIAEARDKLEEFHVIAQAKGYISSPKKPPTIVK